MKNVTFDFLKFDLLIISPTYESTKQLFNETLLMNSLLLFGQMFFFYYSKHFNY